MLQCEVIHTRLKGSGFARRMREVCGGSLPCCPLHEPKYRRILLPGMIGGEVYFALMGLIAQALRIRGAEVWSLQCDELLPACTLRKVDHYESACTRWCHKNSKPFAESMRLPHRWYSEFITLQERQHLDRIARTVPREEITRFQWEQIDLGGLVARSVESYFKVGHFDPDHPLMLDQAYAFLRSGMYLVLVSNRVLEQLEIDKVLIEDGTKVDWGVFRAVAVRRGIPVDVLRAGLRSYSVRFEYDRPGQPSARMPEWELWKDLPLTEREEHALDDYLRGRETVPSDYRSRAWQAHLSDETEVRRLVGIPGEVAGKVFAMFPNVSFDAGKTQTKSAFPTANAWIAETIEHFVNRSRHHLVIKVHPAEYLRAAQDPLIPYIRNRFGELPENIHVIEPQTEITAGSVARLADCVLVYTSTVAVEAAAMGKPVVLVGGGWNTERGISIDVQTPDEYFGILDRMCDAALMPQVSREVARRYAYAFFFRSNFPIRFFSVRDRDVSSVNIQSLEDLSPGRDASLDLICRRILFDDFVEWNDGR